MTRARKIGLGLAGLMLVWLVGPRLLRPVGFFRVRQVELVGVRYLAPDAVIEALHLGPRASVFDDRDRLVERLQRVPGIADVRIVRRFPGVLKVIVREEEPVALVPGASGGPLAVVDGDGRPMPYDPSRGAPDLPVAASADSDLVGVLAMVQAVDPSLYESITAARAERSTVVLELGAGTRRLLVMRDVGPEVIRTVELVAHDLTSRALSYSELDARYAGQIVVRRASRKGT
jgi:cell division septal protein FtsQ